MTLPALSPDQRAALVSAARLELARQSTTGAVRWRDPTMAPLPWQVVLGRVCDRLADSARDGTGLRVTLSAPPRHGKTTFTGQGLPIRCYLDAAARGRPFAVLYVTSTSERAEEVSSRVRAAIERVHGDTRAESMAPGETWTRTRWATKGGLSWVGMGWSGATGGIGANLLILDDVIGTSQAYRSGSTRAQIRRVIEEDLLSRLVDGGAALQMETRRGVDDTTAWLLREWPAVWEEHVWRCRDERGRYLWPEVYGEAWRATMPHLTDSSPVWRSLYQQEPVPEGGTLIPMEWATATYPETPEQARQKADYVAIGCDLTNTKKRTSDPAAFVVVARRGAYRDLLHVVVRQCGYVEQRQILRDLCRTWRPHAVVVERAAGGDQMVDELRGEIAGVRGEPAVGDKVTRLLPHLGRFAAGQVRTPALGASWVGPWREEVTGFSGTDGEADNQVDATVWALVGADDSATLQVLSRLPSPGAGCGGDAGRRVERRVTAPVGCGS